MDTGVVMSSMDHKVTRVLLVMLLCTGLSQSILGQSKIANDKSPRGSIGSPATPHYQAEEKSLNSILSYVQEEPLQMMVYGLVLFSIATTFRRIKSRSRVHERLKANTTGV